MAAQLVPAYLKARDSLGLKGAMWNYWMARRAPIGANLVFIASAMESLMHGWFSTARSPSRGCHMLREEFEQLLHDELVVVERKLSDHPRGENMMNRIRQACSMGVNERFNAFFHELEIELSEAESRALRQRNAPAHGGGVAEDVQSLADDLRVSMRMHEVQQHYRTYETLFHRVVLKLLGYCGTYIDYASFEHPQRYV